MVTVTDEERYDRIIKTWKDATDQVADMMDSQDLSTICSSWLKLWSQGNKSQNRSPGWRYERDLWPMRQDTLARIPIKG